MAAWRAVLTEAAAALDFVRASWAAHLVTQTFEIAQVAAGGIAGIESDEKPNVSLVASHRGALV